MIPVVSRAVDDCSFGYRGHGQIGSIEMILCATHYDAVGFTGEENDNCRIFYSKDISCMAGSVVAPDTQFDESLVAPLTPENVTLPIIWPWIRKNGCSVPPL